MWLKNQKLLTPIGIGNFLAGILVAQAAGIMPGIYPAIKGLASSLKPDTTLKIWLFLLSLSLSLSISISYLLFQSRFIKMFGVLWDKKHNAHCPACRTLLSQYGDYEFGRHTQKAFKCIKCGQLICLTDKTGKILNLEDALSAL